MGGSAWRRMASGLHWWSKTNPSASGKLGARDLEKTVPVAKTEIDEILWSPDGKRLAVGTFEVDHILEVASGKAIVLADDKGRRVRGMAWSPEGVRLPRFSVGRT